ncbi:hypothetical protein B0H10DRAFT_2078700 [Mycena sp. CBHHK59/15]|nr:hypothetical protein B0H10DRAFT_2078700 [Mycena sp. CBHHK59/15]
MRPSILVLSHHHPVPPPRFEKFHSAYPVAEHPSIAKNVYRQQWMGPSFPRTFGRAAAKDSSHRRPLLVRLQLPVEWHRSHFPPITACRQQHRWIPPASLPTQRRLCLLICFPVSLICGIQPPPLPGFRRPHSNRADQRRSGTSARYSPTGMISFPAFSQRRLDPLPLVQVKEIYLVIAMASISSWQISVMDIPAQDFRPVRRQVSLKTMIGHPAGGHLAVHVQFRRRRQVSTATQVKIGQ